MNRNLLTITAILIWTFFTACSSPEPAAPVAVEEAPLAVDADAPADEATNDIPTCDSSPVLVGIDTQSPPFVFSGSEGNYRGFDIDLIEAIAEQVNLDVEFVQTFDFARVFEEVQAGKYHVFISAVTITPERDALVDFSEPYFNDGLMISVKPGSDIIAPADLANRRVGVQSGTTGVEWANQNTAAEVISYAGIDELFEALDQGSIDAAIYDQLLTQQYVQENPQLDLTTLPTTITDEFYGIAVRPDCPNLLAQINEGLAAAMSSGQYAELCETWFGGGDVCLDGQTTPSAPAASTPTAAPPTEESPPAPAGDQAATATSIPETAFVEISPDTLTLSQQESCQLPALTAGAGKTYTIQSGDILSTIAGREYGQPLDYRAILFYNNEESQVDQSLTFIENPDRIEPGWLIYLPAAEQVSAYRENRRSGLPEVDWSASSGDPISVAGSSTLFPLTERLAQCFVNSGFAENSQHQINVASTGTFAGLEAFCAGEIDILDASVPVAEAFAAEDCRSSELLEFQVGIDALAVAVNRSNDFVLSGAPITMAELRQILSTAETWADVRPDWPAEAIVRFYPTAQSGTFGFLAERLFEGDGQALLNAPNAVTSEDDAALVNGLQENPYAVGFFGYAFYRQHADRLQVLPVDGVAPRQETVDTGAYPLLRPLFIYTTAEVLAARPEVANFVNFYLSAVNDHINEVGYFAAPEAVFAQTVERFR